MSAGENRQLVQDHFDAKVRRDQPALRAQMADDVTWWAPQSTEARGLARPVKGREQVIALLMTRGLFKPDGRTWSIHHLVAEGDVVAAHATMRAETVNGHPYENQYVFMFRIQQGRIAEVWEHLDTAHLYALLDS